MSKKEKIKNFINDNKDEIISGVIIGVTGIACFEIGAKFALNDIAKAITEQINDGLEEGKVPVNYKFIGNMFKGFKMIDANH